MPNGVSRVKGRVSPISTYVRFRGLVAKNLMGVSSHLFDCINNNPEFLSQNKRKDSVRNLGFVEAVLNSEKGIISSRRNIGEGGAVCCSIW